MKGDINLTRNAIFLLREVEWSFVWTLYICTPANYCFVGGYNISKILRISAIWWHSWTLTISKVEDILRTFAINASIAVEKGCLYWTGKAFVTHFLYSPYDLVIEVRVGNRGEGFFTFESSRIEFAKWKMALNTASSSEKRSIFRAQVIVFLIDLVMFSVNHGKSFRVSNIWGSWQA